uniref:Uncharacterized protein n=1 Tax=Meloidogyne enterolobii TaxID=390850 RepID=A0A6V7VY30_MELEN|nr:unnamed protein product [Meloidogyne enterolobii]
MNEFEDYKNKFLEKENLRIFDEFDDGKIKRIEKFIKEIEQYNAYIEGYEDQLRDTINELNNCSSFVEGKGKKIEDTLDIFQQDPKLCELEALASKQLKEDWKRSRESQQPEKSYQDIAKEIIDSNKIVKDINLRKSNNEKQKHGDK